MSVPHFDRTLTDAEMKALIGPAFGLGLDDDFDITVIIEARHGEDVYESVASTTDDMGMVERAAERE